MRSFLKQPLPAVLDVGADGLRMMELASDINGVRVVAAGSRMFNVENTTRGPDLAHYLQHLLADAGFSVSRAIVSLPPAIVHLRTLRLPPAPADEFEAALRAQACDSFPFDLHAATLRFFAAGTVRQEETDRVEVTAAAVRRQDIDDLLAALHAGGLRADALRLQPFSLYHCACRAMTAAKGDDDSPLALIEVGATASTVVIGRADGITFIKRIDIGGRHFNEAVAKKLDLTVDDVIDLRRRIAGSPQMQGSPREGVAGTIFAATRALLESLANEVAACFRYHAVTFRGPRPKTVALLGSEATDPHLRMALAACGIPGDLQVINPLTGVDTSEMRTIHRAGPAGEWATCMGLAASMLPSVPRAASNETIEDTIKLPVIVTDEPKLAVA